MHGSSGAPIIILSEELRASKIAASQMIRFMKGTALVQRTVLLLTCKVESRMLSSWRLFVSFHRKVT